MMNRLLLLSALLLLPACRHCSSREPIPTPEEIQRTAPVGGLVQVILRDKDQPQRVTSYLVDIRQDRIVARRDGAEASEQMVAPDSPDMKSASQQDPSFVVARFHVLTDCLPPESQLDCRPDFTAWNGDPRDDSGGGGDPPGHEPDRLVRNFAAYSYWSIRHVKLPHVMKPVQVQQPTRR